MAESSFPVLEGHSDLQRAAIDRHVCGEYGWLHARDQGMSLLRCTYSTRATVRVVNTFFDGMAVNWRFRDAGLLERPVPERRFQPGDH